MPEKVIETKTCKHCSVNFDITDKDVEFYEKVSPSFGGKKYLIPSPTLCPDCRQQRRLSFRNERTLYKRNCDATGKPMISMYNPEVPYTIYHPEFWWSDQWSAFSYGKTIDFECSVFQQIDTLYHTVPLYSLGVSYMTMQNSDYNNMAGYLKDCYMLTNSDDDDSCLYGKGVNRCASCVDNLKIYDSERLYECMSCYNCNDCKYLMNSEGCYQCEVSMNLLNCKFCFGCYNLSGKEYYLFNESLTPEEWKNRVQLICAEKSYVDIQKQLLSTSRIVKEKQIDRNEDSSGDYMYETFHCASCYDVEKMQDSKYCFDLKRGERISDENYDISQFGKGVSRCYEGCTIGYNVSHCICNVDVWENSHDCYYCICCSNISHCFGCIGLRNASYCIFNTQYTKEQYETLVPKIIEHMMKIGEWGEFFPSTMSPFGYNEAEVIEYFPLTKEEAVLPVILSDGKESKDPLNIGKGIPPLPSEGQLLKGERFNWSTYESPPPKVDKIIPADKLPTNIEDIPDDILNWAIECEVTKKPFRIIQQELEFYRKHKLPIPRRHPDQRHLDRMSLRNPRKLYERTCDKCHKAIQTTYAPDRLEKVFCQTCYEKEVY